MIMSLKCLLFICALKYHSELILVDMCTEMKRGTAQVGSVPQVYIIP